MTTYEAVTTIEQRCKVREDAALVYAQALHSRDPIDWPSLNRAILKRWSRAGLAYIKARAWKIAQESAHPPHPLSSSCGQPGPVSGGTGLGTTGATTE